MQQFKPIRVPDIVGRKGGRKIVMLTAYDFTMATLLDSHADILLVGDTLGCVVQGHDTTLKVTLEQMIYHAGMVSRGARQALVVVDLPFGTYQQGPPQALQAALRLLKESDVSAVKLEGGGRVCDSVRAISAAGIPVVAHLGLTPQSFHVLGGNKVQARESQAAAQLLRDARALEEAGAFALVLEAIPGELAGEVSRCIGIPTIGIGAGPDCDGQVLVINDMVGFNAGPAPMRFNKEFGAVREVIDQAATAFAREVRAGTFPARENTYEAAIPSGVAAG
ncbi:3-methyl-2-oxobutanoate hydroxymethyltransferase [Exilibacterium tricleocarpae]|uniref:3-methyl-2-oxobutanoate hydroxymethyltransferase n=1 Tax=Exilibacterium tricleocarpae TaxID=2591008 RepID=A0A545U5N8_9GAMM|nr:3-methyl-2-oxobutanoate hydroxymethyltransferase [Exilibacterium tricleocarpae]TQV84777.1 3-methyl-2-oxobutanoate hydroxymethyltransferase [Exilibacterium tricleocarpae]